MGEEREKEKTENIISELSMRNWMKLNKGEFLMKS